MNFKKYLPTIPQTIQVVIIMIVVTTFGVVSKGRAFVGKLIGR